MRDETYERGRKQGETVARTHTPQERKAMRAWMNLQGQAHQSSMRFLLFVQGFIDALREHEDHE